MRKNILLIRLLYITLCLGIAAITQAQWTGTSDAIKVCTALTKQYNMHTASNGSGGSIIAWDDSKSERVPDNDIYIDNLSSNGTLLWSAANSYTGKAVCTASGSQFIDDLITDALGNVFIIWDDPRISSDNQDIYIQKFNSAGIAQWAADGVPVVTAGKPQSGARIVSDGAGGVIAAWRDFRNDTLKNFTYHNPQTFVQRINSSGTTLWTPDGVSVYNAPILNYPGNVIADGQGGAIISMVDSRNSTIDANGYNTNQDIYAQRINANGILLWGSTGMPVCTQASTQSGINAAPDGNGGAIFHWNDYRNDPGNGYIPPYNADLFTQRINSAGTPLWAANGIAISTAPQDIQSFKIINDGTGGAVAFWLVDSVSKTGTDKRTIYTQRTNAAGVNLWQVNGKTVTDFASPQGTSMDVSPDNIGGVICTWYMNNQIFAQKIDIATGNIAWTAGDVVVCSSSSSVYQPNITTSSTGEAIITWLDRRSYNNALEDIYANKLNNNGTLPVLWGNITGALKGNDAIIQWETLQEFNTKAFEVERSYDGTSFQHILSYTAAVNSTVKRNYEHTDKDVIQYSGKSLYYRVKEMDFDGQYSYSKVIHLYFPKQLSSLKLLNANNTQARLLYMSATTGQAFIRVTDMQGKAAYQKQMPVLKGANQFKINMTNLPAGVYTVIIEQGSFSNTVQLLK